MALPNGYKLLEYIKSTGTQWIDTGFKPKWNSRIVIDASDIQNIGSTGLFGCRNQESATASASYGVLIPSTTSQLRVDYFGKNANLTQSDKTSRTTLDMNKNVFTAFGLTATNTAVSSGQSGINLFLFCYNNVGTANYFSTYAMYSCRIYDDGNLVRDFIPCQKSDGTIGLWDDVNSVFYGNAGTGVFMAGPIISQVPSSPAYLNVSLEDDLSAKLDWAISDTAIGYRLYKNGILISDQTETSYTDTVQLFETIQYSVSAYNEDGEGNAATTTFYASPDNPILYLITDRTQQDVDRARELAKNLNTLTATDDERAEWNSIQLKGAYENSDLNRVTIAIYYLDGLLRQQGYQTGVIKVNVDDGRYTWMENERATPSQIAQYLQNIRALRGVLTPYSTTPNVPADMEKLTWQEANAIEQILVDLESTIKTMMKTRVACGDAYCGGDYL